MVPSSPSVYLEAAYGPRWRRPVRRWNYKYMTHNLANLNSRFIDALYWLKGKYWHWCNPDIYANADGQHDRIVFVDGVFDLFHANHSLFLKEARARGTLLVVAVISDRMAASYKRAPTIPEQERLQMVRSHKSVDVAFIYDESFTAGNLEKIIADYEIDEVVCAGDSTGIWAEYYSPAIKGGFFYQTALSRRPQYESHHGIVTVYCVGCRDRAAADSGEGKPPSPTEWRLHPEC